jgi:hypothetical protein
LGVEVKPSKMFPSPRASWSEITIEYAGTRTGIAAELATATKAAGWTCVNDTFEHPTACKRAGKTVIVRLEEMQPNYQHLHLASSS